MLDLLKRVRSICKILCHLKVSSISLLASLGMIRYPSQTSMSKDESVDPNNVEPNNDVHMNIRVLLVQDDARLLKSIHTGR
jgi:hypothetical protein